MRHLEIIKCVAGAGKTTESINYLKENHNGLYLAYTNSVVDKIKYKGYLSKTIDSLFLNYIIPKFVNVIPIIAKNSKIKYVDSNNLKDYQKSILNISIKDNGDIYNKSKKTFFSLNTKNEDLHKNNKILNQKVLAQIFLKDSLLITQNLLDDISNFIIKNYKEEIKFIMQSRFSYVIIDEAQDLKGFREEFAQLLLDSNISLIIFGDDNQNIINHGKWFESQNATKNKYFSHRCPENICKWIRNNLEINIEGNDNNYDCYKIEKREIEKLNDGQRVLLYVKKTDSIEELLKKWKGQKFTIKTAKGSTIYDDIVIIGDNMNKKNLYTALTRTTKNAYFTIKKISD